MEKPLTRLCYVQFSFGEFFILVRNKNAICAYNKKTRIRL